MIALLLTTFFKKSPRRQKISITRNEKRAELISQRTLSIHETNSRGIYLTFILALIIIIIL